jgi:hypothetical protein
MKQCRHVKSQEQQHLLETESHSRKFSTPENADLDKRMAMAAFEIFWMLDSIRILWKL